MALMKQGSIGMTRGEGLLRVHVGANDLLIYNTWHHLDIGRQSEAGVIRHCDVIMGLIGGDQ